MSDLTVGGAAPAKAGKPGKAAKGGGGQGSGPFTPVMGLALALIGIFSFAALMVLSAFAPELSSGNDGAGHALSKSAIGYAGVVTLMKAQGEPVLISRGPLTGDREEGLLILTPGSSTDGAELTKFNFSGPTLIVLPKWQAAPHARVKGWVRKYGLENAGGLAGRFLNRFSKKSAVFQGSGVTRPVLHGAQAFEGRTFQLGDTDRLQTLEGPGWTPLLADDQGRAVLAQLGDSQIYVLADPDLINTYGLRNLATAKAADAIIRTLRAGQGPILFDVTLNGFKRARSPLRLLLAPPYLGMTLCLVFTAFLIGLHALARFGPPRRSGRAFGFGKQALADNTAALVRMAHREHRMASPYAALTRVLVARAVTAPRDMSDDQLDAFLDRLGTKANTTQSWRDLMVRAKAARDAFEMIAVARDLFRWRREMTREP